jgi:hypothetical protein
MKVVYVLIALVLTAGLAAAAYKLSGSLSQSVPVSAVDPGLHFDQSAGLEDRIRALEQAVAEERNARQLLEEELQVLYAEIDALDEPSGSRVQVDDERAADAQQNRENFARLGSARTSAEGRVEALVAAGLAQDRAEWIVKRETELQLEVMQARFEARRSGESMDRFDPAFNPDAALRAEIGDLEYEQYLEASGRPTMVAVNSVLESSPGQVAGLQPGDQILNYDGQRVFNTFELNRQTMQGTPGDSVVVDILRDGAPMQVVMPRGPIGIYTREGGRRR